MLRIESAPCTPKSWALDIVAAILAWMLLLVVVCSAEETQHWEWSPAASHHAAACRVRSGNNEGGGIYVEYGGMRGVLTAGHIIDNSALAECTWADGHRVGGKATVDKYRNDIAWVFVYRTGVEPLQVATSPPAQGDRVEFVCYGGPQQKLRHWWSTYKRDQSYVGSPREAQYDAWVVSGDSGGAILDSSSHVVGIQSTGIVGHSGGSDWTVYEGSGSATCRAIRQFVDRVRQQHGDKSEPGRCQPGRCQPGRCPSPGPGNQFYPPIPPLVPVKPIEPIEPAEPEQSDRLVELRAELLAAIAKVKALPGEQGPPGSPGEQGPPGLPGAPGVPGVAPSLEISAT